LTLYDDKRQGKYVRADTADLKTDIPRKIFLENVDFPMLLVNKSTKIYLSALQSAFSELQKLQPLKITA